MDLRHVLLQLLVGALLLLLAALARALLLVGRLLANNERFVERFVATLREGQGGEGAGRE